MLKYKRISKGSGWMRYEYYPEGDTSAPGLVEFMDGSPPKLLNESERDIKMFYAIHALYGIDTEKESGTVAWY